MVIFPTLGRNGDLTLDAFSFDEAELDSLAVVLERCGGTRDFRPLATDRHGRAGRRYVVRVSIVSILEQHLLVRFTTRFTLGGRRTLVRFLPGFQSYRCEEITLAGKGSGCADIGAKDDNDAKTKCGLVAGTRGWFGGAASPGTCSK